MKVKGCELPWRAPARGRCFLATSLERPVRFASTVQGQKRRRGARWQQISRCRHRRDAASCARPPHVPSLRSQAPCTTAPIVPPRDPPGNPRDGL